MKKINQISLLSTAFLAGASTVNSQILYTDEIPDLETTGSPLYIDMDQDGTNDFKFQVDNGVWTSDWREFSATVEQLDAGWSFMYISFDNYPVALNDGDIIGPDAMWTPMVADYIVVAGMTYYTNGFCNEPNTGGLGNTWGKFFDASNKFMAFRKKIGANSYYGWLRLTSNFQNPCPLPVGDGIRLIIADYAFNPTANEIIIAGNAGCEVPEPIGAFGLTSTSAKIKWNIVSSADEYHLYYRPVGAIAWMKKKTPFNQKMIGSLLCNTTYEWKVRAKCDGALTDFSPVNNFTTAACKLNEPELSENEITSSVAIYPNPVGEFLSLSSEGIEGAINIEISDLSGRILQIFEMVNTEYIQMNMAELEPGIYLITIKGDNFSETKQFVKI